MSSKGTAIVTGAAQGLGRAIALRLAEDGFDIALNDIPSKNIVHLGRRAGVFPADVAVEDEVRALIDAVMVANAGICKGGAFLDVSIDDWDRTFSINVRGVFLCYQYAARQMVAQGRGGRIIGACSLAGKQGAPKLACYSSSKFAVRGLTQSAAQELGAHGITVNAYAPGIIESPMTDAFAHAAGIAPKIVYDRQAAKTPLGKNGQPEDVAAIVSYLASAESSFMTGQTISVNGGRYFD
ncbi:hypothetical protein DFH09DRAFT_1257540 [Mycena vulgaris]|nr:hypothetical protein DFH09DRAFT_1257540 [Mycena vulgaris]